VVTNLSALNLAETQQKFDSLVTNLNTVLAGSGKGNQGMAQSVQELNTLLAKMNSVTSNAELELLTQELVASAVVLRQMLSSAFRAIPQSPSKISSKPVSSSMI
jgi:ABC-type transporter Mla subunit MlaD